MSFPTINPPDWAWPADPADLARIVQAENEARNIPTTDSDDEFEPEDLPGIAAEVAMDLDRKENEDFETAIRLSRDTAIVEELQHPTTAEADRTHAEEDEETRLALDVSRVMTEQADLDCLAADDAEQREILGAQLLSEREARIRYQEDIRKAESLSRSEERARAQAAREEEEYAIFERTVAAERERQRQEGVNKAIIETKAATERERKRKAEELARLQADYAVYDLSEDEQMQLAIWLSQDDEHLNYAAEVEQTRPDMPRSVIEHEKASQRSATQDIHGRPVLEP
jgi:hypothetical protein